MKCKEFEDHVSAYLECELVPLASRQLEQHAASCPQCAATLAGVRAIRQALRELGTAAAPAQYQLRVAGCLGQGQPAGALWARTLTLGLTLVLAAAILLWPQADTPANRQPPPAASVWDHQAGAWTGRRLGPADPEGPLFLTSRPSRGHYTHAPARLASY